MKKKILTLFVSSLFIFLTACGTSSDNKETTEAETAEDNSTEETAATTETTEDNLAEEETNTDESETEESTTEEDTGKSDVTDTGSRTEPLSIGSTAKIEVLTYGDDGEEKTGHAEIIIDNLLRGEEALQAMEDEEYGMEYEPYEEEGYEWIVFDLTYKLLDASDDDHEFLIADDVKIYTEDGSPAPTEYTSIADEFGVQYLLSGGEANGKVVAVAPVNESFLIKFGDGISESAWFKAD